MNGVEKLIAQGLYLLEKHKLEDARRLYGRLEKNATIKKEYGSLLKSFQRKIELMERHKLEYDEEGKLGLYFYIINPCDFRCIFCDRSIEEVRSIKNVTTLEDIQYILKLYSLEKIHHFLVGGHEPLANVKIIEIIEYLYSLKPNIVLYTSASRPQILRDLVGLGYIHKVFLPKYSSSEDIQDQITSTNGSLKMLEECIDILNTSHVTFTLTTVILRQNLDQISNFMNSNTYLLLPNNIFTLEFYKKNGVCFSEYIILFKKLLSLGKNLKNFFIGQYVLPPCVLYQVDKNLYSKLINDILNVPVIDIPRENMDSRSFTTVKKCESCKLHKNCKGYYQVHFDVFGSEEVIPVN